MIDLSPPPAATHSEPVRDLWCHLRTQRALCEKPRKVDARVYSELQRSPEPAVHFHEIRLTGSRVAFVFDHCYATPREAIEQRARPFEQICIKRYAFPVDADATRRRLFAKPPVRKRRALFAVPEQEKNPCAWSDNALLHEQRKRRWRSGAYRANQFVGVARVRDRDLGPSSIESADGTRGLEDDWIGQGMDVDRSQGCPVRNDLLGGDCYAKTSCFLEKTLLIG